MDGVETVFSFQVAYGLVVGVFDDGENKTVVFDFLDRLLRRFFFGVWVDDFAENPFSGKGVGRCEKIQYVFVVHVEMIDLQGWKCQ